MISQITQVPSHEALFTQLYLEAFPAAASFVRKMGGSLEDAKDVFHDALVIYYEKKMAGNFSPEQENDSAYLVGIAKHLWYRKFKQDSRNTFFNDALEAIEEETDPSVSPSLISYLEASGKKCLELLRAFYYDKLSMKEVAGRFDFSGERSATAQKFKCLEKVRNAMRERSLTKADFYE